MPHLAGTVLYLLLSQTARTSACSPIYAASAFCSPCRRPPPPPHPPPPPPEKVPPPPPAIPATFRTQVQTVVRVPGVNVAPAPGFFHLSKSRSANHRAARSIRNKNGSFRCRPPRCTKFRAFPLREIPTSSRQRRK